MAHIDRDGDDDPLEILRRVFHDDCTHTPWQAFLIGARLPIDTRFALDCEYARLPDESREFIEWAVEAIRQRVDDCPPRMPTPLKPPPLNER